MSDLNAPASGKIWENSSDHFYTECPRIVPIWIECPESDPPVNMLQPRRRRALLLFFTLLVVASEGKLQVKRCGRGGHPCVNPAIFTTVTFKNWIGVKVARFSTHFATSERSRVRRFFAFLERFLFWDGHFVMSEKVEQSKRFGLYSSRTFICPPELDTRVFKVRPHPSPPRPIDFERSPWRRASGSRTVTFNTDLQLYLNQAQKRRSEWGLPRRHYATLTSEISKICRPETHFG